MKTTFGLLGMVLLGWACSEADLYSRLGEEPLGPDRIAITGKLCTEDTSGANFPAKVLLMLDSSIQMFGADPTGYRFSSVGNGFGALVNRYQGQQHVRFGFVGLAGSSRALPAPNGQRFFHPQDPEVQLAISAWQNPMGNQRDIINAVAQAESFITADMAESNPGEVLRSRYIVYLMTAGPPSPTFPPGVLAEHVAKLKQLVYARGALEFRFHIGNLYYGPLTVTGSDERAACVQPGSESDPLCACSATEHGDADYCAAFCALEAGTLTEAPNEAAREAYSAMTLAGDGVFTQFACAQSINVSFDIASSGINLVKKDIVAYNRNVRMGRDGPQKDSDGDGLSDIDELGATPATDPTLWDTDGDGLGDALEFRAYPRQDPTDPSDRPKACPDPLIFGPIPDTDLDLLNDCEEGLLQTNPSIPDTDGDGLPDFLEFASGTVPTSAADRLMDFDGDGMTNAQEVLEHLNPRSSDAHLRGEYGYRNRIIPLGVQPIASMGGVEPIAGVSFRQASGDVVGGQAYMRWDACAETLEWSDARHQLSPRFEPIPTPIEGSGIYTLVAQAANGEKVSADFYVTRERLPSCATTSEVVRLPLLSVSPRNCYDVRISNIQLMHTDAANGNPQDGINHVLLFFTQAPSDRLSAPGIARVAELRVRFVCRDPNDITTCSRNPKSGIFQLVDTDFASTVP